MDSHIAQFAASVGQLGEAPDSLQRGESPFMGFHAQNVYHGSVDPTSPTLSETSVRTGSSLSLDVSAQEQCTSPGASNGRRPLRNTNRSATPRFLNDQIINQMPEHPLRLRGHRRAHSEILPTPSLSDENLEYALGRGDSMAVLGGGRDDGDALLSELMNFSGIGLGEQEHQTEFVRSNANSEIDPATGSGAGGPGGGGGLPLHTRSLSVDDGLLGSYSPLSPVETSSPVSGERRGVRRNFHCRSDADNLDELDGEEAVRRVLASKKLQDIETLDPKRAKRILANRQSAARSKERKTRYISELEEKVAYYEKQSTALKATLTLLQRETTSLAEVNEGMSKKMQMMEKLYREREVENKQLLGEVELLRQATGQLTVGKLSQQPQLSLEEQMLALLQLRPQELSALNLQHQQQVQQQHLHQQQQQQQHQHQQQQEQRLFAQLQLALQSQQTDNFARNSLGTLSSMGNNSFGSNPLNFVKNEGRS